MGEYLSGNAYDQQARKEIPTAVSDPQHQRNQTEKKSYDKRTTNKTPLFSKNRKDKISGMLW
jgi:hypothetical protein